MKPKLFLIRGLPGSGKSTLARSMIEAGVVDAVFEADNYFIRDGKYKFNAKTLPLAHEYCQDRTMTAFREGKSVAVANTFTRHLEMEPYTRLGYETVIITCKGKWPNIHGVPDEAIQRMADRWEE